MFFLLHIHIYRSPEYIQSIEIQEGKIQWDSGHSKSNSMSSSTASALVTLLFISQLLQFFVIAAANQQEYGIWNWDLEFWTLQKSNLTSDELTIHAVLNRDASGLAREPTYRLNFVGYSWQPTKLSLYVGSQARSLCIPNERWLGSSRTFYSKLPFA